MNVNAVNYVHSPDRVDSPVKQEAHEIDLPFELVFGPETCWKLRSTVAFPFHPGSLDCNARGEPAYVFPINQTNHVSGYMVTRANHVRTKHHQLYDANVYDVNLKET